MRLPKHVLVDTEIDLELYLYMKQDQIEILSLTYTLVAQHVKYPKFEHIYHISRQLTVVGCAQNVCPHFMNF